MWLLDLTMEERLTYMPTLPIYLGLQSAHFICIYMGIQARICLYMSPPPAHHSISQGKDLINRIWEGIDTQWLVKTEEGKIDKAFPLEVVASDQ